MLGKRSRQITQSELYARCITRFGGTAVYDGGYGDAGQLAELCRQRLGWKKFLRNAAALLVLFFLLGCVLVGVGMLIR